MLLEEVSDEFKYRRGIVQAACGACGMGYAQRPTSNQDRLQDATRPEVNKRSDQYTDEEFIKTSHNGNRLSTAAAKRMNAPGFGGVD